MKAYDLTNVDSWEELSAMIYWDCCQKPSCIYWDKYQRKIVSFNPSYQELQSPAFGHRFIYVGAYTMLHNTKEIKRDLKYKLRKLGNEARIPSSLGRHIRSEEGDED